MKIALFSAFPQELKYIRKDSFAVPGDHPFRIHTLKRQGFPIVAVETGMKAGNIQAAFEHVALRYRPDVILSLGFGGALCYRSDIGELVFASRYLFLTHEGPIEFPGLSLWKAGPNRRIVNEPMLTRLRQNISIKEGSFVTLSAYIEKPKLKRLIPGNLPFPVCDRETMHLAKMSYKQRLPFFAIRAITDRGDEDIPKEFFDVIDNNGNYLTSRALAVLVSRPSLIARAFKLGRHADLAARNLERALDAFIGVLPHSADSRRLDQVSLQGRAT
jgi:nucleoside phosphorylase